MSVRVTDERVMRVLSQCLDVAEERLSPESSRDTLEEWDSMGHIMLMLAVEKQFARKLPFAVIERIRCIRDLREALNSE